MSKENEFFISGINNSEDGTTNYIVWTSDQMSPEQATSDYPPGIFLREIARRLGVRNKDPDYRRRLTPWWAEGVILKFDRQGTIAPVESFLICDKMITGNLGGYSVRD